MGGGLKVGEKGKCYVEGTLVCHAWCDAQSDVYWVIIERRRPLKDKAFLAYDSAELSDPPFPPPLLRFRT